MRAGRVTGGGIACTVLSHISRVGSHDGCRKELSVSSELVSDRTISTMVPGGGGVQVVVLFCIWILGPS